jgi:hypothetical protein
MEGFATGSAFGVETARDFGLAWALQQATSMTNNPAPTAWRRSPARLFKRDRPRGIDRYIDYFGGAGAPGAGMGDPGGEALHEHLDPASDDNGAGPSASHRYARSR